MSKTEENLKAAFAGESQASRKYLAFAKKAEEEGFKGVAKLFRAAVESETIHALRHLNNLNEIKDTKENLKAAINGENYEHTNMYPQFIKEAENEDKSILYGFVGANETEKVHEGFFKDALSKAESNQDIEEKTYYVCTVCGYTMGEEIDICPICNAGKDKFEVI